MFCRIDGKPFKDIRGGFKNALKRAGLDSSIRIHDLRHTFASWMIASGAPTSVVKDMGAMVSRYTHLGHRTLFDVANKIMKPSEESGNAEKTINRND